MAIKREIIIEVDDKGAIKSVEGLTDAIEDNTKATEKATDANEAFEASIQKQQAQMKVLDGAVNLVGGSIETLAGGLVLSGALSDEQAEAFEGAAVGAIAFADGMRRTIDGVVNLREGLKVLTQGQKLATIATKAFGVAQKVAMGPVGIAIAAITGLAAIIIGLKDKFEAVNKVATFFSNIISKVATAVGLGKTETEKYQEAQGKLSESTARQLELLQAQGASTEQLIKKERELLTQRKNAAKTDEERVEATQALAVFEARVAREKREREEAEAAAEKERRQKAYQERKAQREKEEAEEKAAAEKKAEEEAQRIADEKQKAIDAENDRLESLADVAEDFRKREEDIAADTEVKRLELAKQRQLDELEALGATEEQKLQIIDFYNARIVEANDKAQAEIDKANDAADDKQKQSAKAVAEAKIAATMSSVDAIQGALGDLFGESKAVAKANVLIDAAQAGIGIIKSSQSIPAPFNAIFAAAQLAALAASSAAAIREINAAEPGSGGGGGVATTGPRSVPNGSTGASIGPGPQLGTTPTTTEPQPIKAYVLSGEVTSAQSADRKLNQRRTL
jgi:actin-related protein